MPAPKALEFLLPTQRNLLFRIFEQSGFPLSEFEWFSPSGSPPMHTVRTVHKPSGYWFQFVGELHGPYLYSPGESSRIGNVPEHSLAEIADCLQWWFGNLRRELSEPDLWEIVSTGTQLSEAATDTDNRPFTIEEQQFIAAQLREILSYVVATHELSQAHVKFIESRVEYMIESSKRLGRKDWYNIVLGALAGAVASSALPSSALQELITMVSRTLQPLFQHAVKMLS